MRVALALILASVCSVAAAQDRLEPVRELYASADYEGALSALGHLRGDDSAIRTVEIDRYRVFCLVALGRSVEAEKVIEGILTEDPLYDPSSADAPPRIRAAFAEVRRRVLPPLVRGFYAEGKAAFDRKSFPEAVQKLERTLQVIDVVMADEPELADLRTLTTGFLDLSRASITPAPTASEPAPNGSSEESPLTEKIAPLQTDPIVRRQVLPPWTYPQAGALFEAEFRGAIEVDIDERGLVVGAEITKPIHPLYDILLLQAARDWQYEPARRNGEPVKGRKRVDVVLRPR